MNSPISRTPSKNKERVNSPISRTPRKTPGSIKPRVGELKSFGQPSPGVNRKKLKFLNLSH